LQGLSPCGPPGQPEILDINELAFDNYKETENYNLGGVKDQVRPIRQAPSEARHLSHSGVRLYPVPGCPAVTDGLDRFRELQILLRRIQGRTPTLPPAVGDGDVRKCISTRSPHDLHTISIQPRPDVLMREQRPPPLRQRDMLDKEVCDASSR
jgi:hypothetical protein